MRVAKNTAALFLARASVLLFTFAFAIYAARLLGVERFGRYALVWGLFLLFLNLAASGLRDVTTREVAKQPAWAERYICSAIVLVFGITLVAVVVLVLIANIAPYAPETRVAIYLACLALIPATIGVVFEAGFVAFEKSESIMYATLLENALRIGLGFFALFMGYGVAALFVALIVSRTAMLVFYIDSFSRKVERLRWFFSWSFLRQLISEWRVFALENSLSSTFWGLDVVVLSFFGGEFAVGVYSAAYRVLSLGTAAAGSYTTAAFPHMSKLFESSKEAFHRTAENTLKYMLALILPGVIAIAIFADRVILLLYGNEYAASIPILRVLVWVLILRFLNPYLSYILFARGEQGKSLKVVAFGLAVYAIFSIWFTQRWGGIGTAWALLLAVCVAFCLYFAFAIGGEGLARMLRVFSRTALAAGSLGLILFVFREGSLIPLLVVAGALYLTLLIIFRVPTRNEIKWVRMTAQRGLSRAEKVLRST